MEDDRMPQVYASAATTNQNCSIGIGCMSSKRRGTAAKKKKLDGWFVKLMCGSKHQGPRCDLHSLDSNTETSKTTKSPHSAGSAERKNRQQSTKLKSSQQTKDECRHQLKSFTAVIKRGPTSFGFSLDGLSPAYISKVESGSPAASAGLQKGDFIMRYNGQNVSRLSARELKSIILRSGLPRIILDIQRGDVIDTEENKENRIAVKTALPSYITSEMHDELSNFSGSSSFAALRRGSFTEMATIHSAQLSEDNYTYDSHEAPDNGDGLSEIKESTRIPQDLPNELHDHQSAVQKLLKLEKQFVQQMSLGIQQYSRPLRHCVISTQHHQVLFQNIEKLVAVSEFHVRQLNEKSATYSEAQWGATYSGSAKSVIDAVGGVYLPRIKIVCDSYMTYLHGLDAARNLLSGLKGYPEFNMFLQTSDEVYTEMSIEDFVDSPCLHLKNLHEHLKLVAANTPSHHHDHFPIHQVLHEMNTAMIRIYQLRNKLSKKHPSGASLASGSSGYSGSSGLSKTSTYSGSSRSSTFSKSSGLSRLSGGSRSSDYMGSFGLGRSSDTSLESTFFSKLSADETLARGGSSVAVDALSFQQRLAFPSHIQKSKFVPLMRHLIYCGELMWKSPDSQWTTVCAALFSDLLILTRLDTSGKLNVVREPLPLSQVAHLSFMSPHPSEFKVRSMMGEKSMELRAKTLEQKCVWKNLLEQRLAAVRTSSLERTQKQKVHQTKITDNRL